MAVNVNTFKLFCEFIANKVQAGQSVSPSQFNLVANQAQMVLFEKDFQNYILTGEMTDYLRTFLKNTILPVSAIGVANIPSDMQHVASMRHYYVGKKGGAEVEVKPVKNESWGNIQVSQLLQPSRRFPKYQELASTFLILPRTVGTVTLDYFKTPVAPIWNYTVVSNRPVYNPTGSVDFEWGSFALNNVASIYLSLVGVNIKDSDLYAFSQQFRAETNSNL